MDNQLTLLPTLDESDDWTGVIRKVKEYLDGVNLEVEEEGMQYGFVIYKEDFVGKDFPQAGDEVVVRGVGEPEGIRFFQLNELTFFDRDRKLATLYKEKRDLERDLRSLESRILAAENQHGY